MLVKNPEDCDTNQHRRIVSGTVSMSTRGKVRKYVAARNERSGKAFCYLGG